jgi:hypothetical protein
MASLRLVISLCQEDFDNAILVFPEYYLLRTNINGAESVAISPSIEDGVILPNSYKFPFVESTISSADKNSERRNKQIAPTTSNESAMLKFGQTHWSLI